MTLKDETRGAVAEALAELLKPKGAVDWNHQDPDIGYDGKKIILPDQPGKMGLREAAKLLNRKAEDEETEMDVYETIEAFPLDGAVAFVKAMKELYGWASPIPTMTFFGPQAPKLVTVEIAPLDESPNFVQVPWGEFTIPGIENSIQTGAKMTPTGPVFQVYGSVKKREQGILRELADKAREILKTSSIYKGKAIRLKADENGKLNVEVPPTFISTKYINPDELILNPDEYSQIAASLWAPITQTATVRKYGIPLKRGVLLEGPYGGGKTMTANVTSKICKDNGWTFILLDDIRALKDALLFAQRYAPAVVFAEDADRVATVRDQRGNDLLNTIDGVLSKNSEVITVLTTNFVERLDRAMLRPGRLDAIISIRPPENEAVQRLVHLYSRGLIKDGENLAPVGEALKGNIPATIREVVERSKLGMIGRGDTQLIANDLLASASSMKRHLELLNFQPVSISDGDQLAVSLKKILTGTIVNGVVQSSDDADKKIMDQLAELENTIRANVIGNLIAVKEQGQIAKRSGDTLGKMLEDIKAGVKKVVNFVDQQ